MSTWPWPTPGTRACEAPRREGGHVGTWQCNPASVGKSTDARVGVAAADRPRRPVRDSKGVLLLYRPWCRGLYSQACRPALFAAAGRPRGLNRRAAAPARPRPAPCRAGPRAPRRRRDVVERPQRVQRRHCHQLALRSAAGRGGHEQVLAEAEAAHVVQARFVARPDRDARLRGDRRADRAGQRADRDVAGEALVDEQRPGDRQPVVRPARVLQRGVEGSIVAGLQVADERLHRRLPGQSRVDHRRLRGVHAGAVGNVPVPASDHGRRGAIVQRDPTESHIVGAAATAEEVQAWCRRRTIAAMHGWRSGRRVIGSARRRRRPS